MDSAKSITFYSEALDFLYNLKSSFEDKREYLSSTNFENYVYKFKGLATSFKAISKNIDDFSERWKGTEDNVCNMISTLKNYVEYYTRLCETSTNFNYETNSNYIKDSMSTIILVVETKLKFLVKNEKIR